MKPVPAWTQWREDLTALHAAALAAADPSAAVRRVLELRDGRLRAGESELDLDASSCVRMVALGKASCGMARAALEVLGSRISAGVVAHPHGLDPGAGWPAGIRTVAAGHPLPDAGSLAAGAAALEMLRGGGPRDVALVLVSGGGSALFESLRHGITLQDLREVTEALQRAGAGIRELNVVRRALSRVKAGGLARAAAPARVVTLLLSDVVGDHLEAIASGPTVPSPTGPREALSALEGRFLTGRFPALAAALGEAASDPERAAPPAQSIARIVGSNRDAAEALCTEAERRGFRTLLLTDRLQGEAREAGHIIGAIARGMQESGLPAAPPACIVLGGETTVTVRGGGRGGRNLEVALGAALALEGCDRTIVLSFATDGMDGSSGAAGALARGDTIGRARSLGLSASRTLEENDSEPFFRTLGDLWITGPSGTNVNDLVVAIAYPG